MRGQLRYPTGEHKHMTETTYTEAAKTKNNIAQDDVIRLRGARKIYAYRTYSGRTVSLWPPSGDPGAQISIRDIANNLAKTNYFPEAAGAPFTAAQYACELAAVMRAQPPFFQIRAFIDNAHEAYLGHASKLVRAAERGVTPAIVGSDRRDEMENVLTGRIRQALCIPDLDRHLSDYVTASVYARWKLDATLERDIGACIFPQRDNMDDDMQRLAQPLRRKISPMIWINAMERYLRTFSDLAAICGIPVVE